MPITITGFKTHGALAHLIECPIHFLTISFTLRCPLSHIPDGRWNRRNEHRLRLLVRLCDAIHLIYPCRTWHDLHHWTWQRHCLCCYCRGCIAIIRKRRRTTVLKHGKYVGLSLCGSTATVVSDGDLSMIRVHHHYTPGLVQRKESFILPWVPLIMPFGICMPAHAINHCGNLS